MQTPRSTGQRPSSAANYVAVYNAATGGPPILEGNGSDTNVDLTLRGKGTGGVIAVFKQSTGLGLLASDSSHALQLKTSSNLAATRQLDFITGDANRSITLAANLNVSGAAEISGTHTGTHSGTSSGTNTGDQTVPSAAGIGLHSGSWKPGTKTSCAGCGRRRACMLRAMWIRRRKR